VDLTFPSGQTEKAKNIRLEKCGGLHGRFSLGWLRISSISELRGSAKAEAYLHNASLSTQRQFLSYGELSILAKPVEQKAISGSIRNQRLSVCGFGNAYPEIERLRGAYLPTKLTRGRHTSILNEEQPREIARSPRQY
jgi:hypothetical protein